MVPSVQGNLNGKHTSQRQVQLLRGNFARHGCVGFQRNPGTPVAGDKKMAKSLMISSGSSMVEAKFVQSLLFTLGSVRVQYLPNMPVPLSGWATPNLASPQSLRLFIGPMACMQVEQWKKAGFEKRTFIIHSNSDGFFKVLARRHSFPI